MSKRAVFAEIFPPPLDWKSINKKKASKSSRYCSRDGGGDAAGRPRKDRAHWAVRGFSRVGTVVVLVVARIFGYCINNEFLLPFINSNPFLFDGDMSNMNCHIFLGDQVAIKVLVVYTTCC